MSRIAIFAPHPLLTVTLEREGPGREQVHFHPGGQGVWVARTLACMGADSVLCGFLGGESGDILEGLLGRLQGVRRLVRTASASGCYVTDRRSGERELLTFTLSGDAMMGALTASWSQCESFEQAVRVGAAAGAANFLRHGLGSASRESVEQLIESVALEPLTARV